MIHLTVRHYECAFSQRAMQVVPKAEEVTEYTTDKEPADFSSLGNMVAPWILVGPNTKQAQFCKRIAHKRVDHLFIVSITETNGGDA